MNKLPVTPSPEALVEVEVKYAGATDAEKYCLAQALTIANACKSRARLSAPNAARVGRGLGVFRNPSHVLTTQGK